MRANCSHSSLQKKDWAKRDMSDLLLGIKRGDNCQQNTKTPFFDITKINIKDYIGDTSSTKVLCKDGTFGYDISSSNAKYDNSKTCMNNGGRAENQSVIKELQSKEQVKKQIDEEIAKIKFPLKSTLITSAVPLGLAYYSYYNNYSLTKGIGVVVIGSVVAFYGAIMFSGGKFV